MKLVTTEEIKSPREADGPEVTLCRVFDLDNVEEIAYTLEDQEVVSARVHTISGRSFTLSQYHAKSIHRQQFAWKRTIETTPTQGPY